MKIKPKKYWTKERCLDAAKKYTTKIDFRKENPSAYSACLRKGWYDEATQHMDKNNKKHLGYWTKERCLDAAKKYTTKSDFRKNCQVVYSKCSSKKWLNYVYENANLQ